MEKLIRIVRGANHVAVWGLFWAMVAFVGVRFMPETESVEGQPYVAQVDIYGEIQIGLTDQVKSKLLAAYNDPYAKVIILHVISEGGSPYEAWRLCTFIDLLRSQEAKRPAEEQRKILSIIGPVGASAAYMISLCTDGIYASPSSLIGSIGAVMTYQKEEEKIKYIPSGSAKVLDLNTVHGKKRAEEFVQIEAAQFLEMVLKSRTGKLKASVEELRTGRLWYGKTAVEQGLIDGFSTPEFIAHELGDIAILYPGTPEQTVWDKVKDVLSAIQLSHTH